MIKKILLAVLMVLPFMGAKAQTLKIGLVNTDEILAAMPQMAEAQKKLADVSKTYEDEYKKLTEEMNTKLEEFQKSENELPAIRERKARELQDLENKIRAFEQSAQNDLQRMQNELMAPILQLVQQAVESVGKENGFSMIQVYSPQLTLYYGAPVEDVTPLVKKKLGIK